MSGSFELSVGLSDPSQLSLIAADSTLETNLRNAIGDTLSVDPNTVEINSVNVGLKDG